MMGSLASKRYALEDFTVGQVIPLGTRSVTADEIVAFAKQFDPQPFHVDPAEGERSIYGTLIASGWHTAAMLMRMGCDAYLLDSTSAGSPGVDELRWLRPVRPGDTIRGEIEVVEVRHSRSKPDRGLMTCRWRAFNQNDELILTMRGMGMFLRRAT
jgi:acyl dehydratase